jgi:glycosyltransferase involved in cell wall biosynthesis
MKFLVAIPVYNEEKYIERVLRCVNRFADDVLIINDGSSDMSAEKARAVGATVIDHSANRGYGKSVRDAFSFASDNGYDVVVTMDADMQHLPRHIPAFLYAIEGYDIVSGSRYLAPQPDDTSAPADRVSINRTITEAINSCTGYHLTDAFCGFKAYRVKSIGRLDLREDGYAMPLELWIQSAAAGLAVKEIPVSLIYVDNSRSFGRDLDDARIRLAHYRQVLSREAQRAGLCTPAFGDAAPDGAAK